jgi:electron transfer flavoprotein-quinone oxidoreductase
MKRSRPHDPGLYRGHSWGGFLYTNQDSISLGCVFMPEEVARHGQSVHQIFQNFKMHPSIYPLLEGGETCEYAAHLVSEDGFRGIPGKLYRDGFLMIGDAAGFVINTGSSIRGIDLAILSGIAAARAVIDSQDPVRVGPAYMQELNNIGLIPAMKAVDGYKDLLEIPRIYTSYPGLAADVFTRLFTVDGQVPRSLRKEIKGLLKQNQLSLWQLLKDGLRGYRSI